MAKARIKPLPKERKKPTKEVARIVTTSVSTLTPAPFIVRRPIPVTIQVTDEDSIASFLEANVNASGDTLQEAFRNLCDMLIAKFDFLESLDPAKLGREPQRQLAVLREFVAKE